jgi:hypothetical protein
MYASWLPCNWITYRGQVPVTTPLHLPTVFIPRSNPPKQDDELLERVHSYSFGIRCFAHNLEPSVLWLVVSLWTSVMLVCVLHLLLNSILTSRVLRNSFGGSTWPAQFWMLIVEALQSSVLIWLSLFIDGRWAYTMGDIRSTCFRELLASAHCKALNYAHTHPYGRWNHHRRLLKQSVEQQIFPFSPSSVIRPSISLCLFRSSSRIN